MKKKNFVTLILGFIGCVLFALGMCMALVLKWNAMKPGIITGVLGAAVLLVMVLVRRKMDGKPLIAFHFRTVCTVLLGLIGAVVFGIGLCLIMVWDNMVPGIIVGLIGILLLLCLIPAVRGLK